MNKNVFVTGVKKLLLTHHSDQGAVDPTTASVRVLFGPPPEAATGDRGSDLVDFLKQVTLFKDLGRSDLRQLARIVHERSYRDGETIYQQGKPGVALFVIRRGVVEIVRRRRNGEDVPLALLEPPASFEELAVTDAEVVRWASARAHGPVSLVALGCSDLDALSHNLPLLANKILKKLVQIAAMRLQMLVEAEYFQEEDKESKS
jgi:signal-transduction protein with cAMP-binding, CBS, and nucleotidyltransferase domain